MNKSLIAIGLAGFALTACDTGLQDGGSDTRVGMNGLAVDGRVAFGKVWVDMNNNNKIDDFEPFAFTDSEGYYSYNPNTPKDYCALDTTDADYKHCLKYGSSVDSTVIRISGGTDLATGEKLKGVMAMATSIGASKDKSTSPLVLSPITTLLEAADTPAKKAAIRTALGIESDADLKVDFSAANNEKTKKLYANAVALQTMVDLLVAGRDANSSKTDAQLQQDVIDKIVDTMSAGSGKKLTELTADDLAEIAASVTSDDNKKDKFKSRIASINSILVQIETAADSEVKALVKTSEVITQLVRKEVKGEDTAAVAKVLGADTTAFNALRDTLKTGLSAGDSFDIRSVTNSLVKEGEKDAAFDPNTVVSDLVENAELATSNRFFASYWFILEASGDLANDVSEGDYIAVGFAGNTADTSGVLHVCVNITSEEEDGDSFQNEYIGGTWTILNQVGPTQNIVALLLNYEGLEFSGQMKALAEKVPGEELYRFSSDLIDKQGDLKRNAFASMSLASPAGEFQNVANNTNARNAKCEDVNSKLNFM